MTDDERAEQQQRVAGEIRRACDRLTAAQVGTASAMLLQDGSSAAYAVVAVFLRDPVLRDALAQCMQVAMLLDANAIAGEAERASRPELVEKRN